MQRTLRPIVQRALTGFAAGVMVAASIWSLLIPAMEQSAPMGKLSLDEPCNGIVQVKTLEEALDKVFA